ncbi:MAG: HWE histidine kinase domain-containing protein [Brevundimonas sp.]
MPDPSPTEPADNSTSVRLRRVNNLAARIRSISRRTARHARDIDEFNAWFDARLDAIVRAHNAVLRSDGSQADLGEVIFDALESHCIGRRNWTADGPYAPLPSGLLEALALVVHELAFEASLSGALGGEAARVAVSWTLDGDPETLTLEWREDDVVDRVVSPGFGFLAELMERSLPQETGARTSLETSPTGLVARVEARVSAGGVK